MIPSVPGAGARQQHARLAAARRRREARLGHDAASVGETAAERAWRVGAEGEERLGAALNEWVQTCGLGVLHDLRLPGQRRNIDHVVVGAGGVTVIDAKAWTGTVRITASGIWMGKWGHRKAIDGLRRQVADVRTCLAARGLADVPVRGTLCLVNSNEGCPARELLTIDDIAVGRPQEVARYAASGSALHETTVEAIHAALVEAFEVSGGERGPRQLLAGTAAPPLRPAPGARTRSSAASQPDRRETRASPAVPGHEQRSRTARYRVLRWIPAVGLLAIVLERL